MTNKFNDLVEEMKKRAADHKPLNGREHLIKGVDSAVPDDKDQGLTLPYSSDPEPLERPWEPN